MITNTMRPLPPDILLDRRLIKLDLPVKWTAIGLRMYVDEHGREALDPFMLRAAIWPGHPEVTTAMVEDHVLELDQVGYVVIYPGDGETLFAMAKWGKLSHSKMTPSLYPPPPPESVQIFSGFQPDEFSAVERESGSEGGERVGPPRILLDGTPSPFCDEHHPTGAPDDQDCRNCGTKRLAAKLWERDKRLRAKAALAEPR